MKYEEFKISGEHILQEFNELTKGYAFLIKAIPDHICYKCKTRKEFETIRNWYEKHGQWIYQTEISGRAIATIKLREPFRCWMGEVWYLELSDQKPDGSQEESWDHMEVKHREDRYDELVDRAQNIGLDVIEKVRPHHTTHEVMLENSFKLVFTREMLGEKIKKEM